MIIFGLHYFGKILFIVYTFTGLLFMLTKSGMYSTSLVFSILLLKLWSLMTISFEDRSLSIDWSRFFFFFILPKLLVEGIWSWLYIWIFDLELLLVNDVGKRDNIGSLKIFYKMINAEGFTESFRQKNKLNYYIEF